MPTTVSFNGNNYSVPNNREPKGWGADLTTYLIALGQNSLAKSGGSFTLLSEVNFGATFGIVSAYVKSASANIAATGVFRLANDEAISWRNAANDGDLALKANASNQLEYNGNRIIDVTDTAYTEIVRTTTDQTITGAKTFDKQITMKELTSDPAAPASGYMAVYPKDDKNFYTRDSDGNIKRLGSGAGGGLLNLIINSDGDDALDQSATNDVGDWIDSGSGVVASVTETEAEIPLFPIKEKAIKLSLAAGTNDYTRVRFRVPEAYRNTVLSLSWSQLHDTFAAEGMKIELYNYSDAYATDEAEVSLYSDDDSGDTFIPVRDGIVQTGFTSDDRDYYELRFINNGVSSGYLSLNEVSIDKGSVGEGSAGGWKQYVSGGSEGLVISHSSWALERGVATPYKDPITGVYRLKFNALFDRGSEGGFTTADFTISGVTFSSGYLVSGQPVTVFISGTASTNGRNSANAAALPGSSTVRMHTDSSAMRYVGISGDVELDTKPTWADFDGTVKLIDQGAATTNARFRTDLSAIITLGGASTTTVVPFDTTVLSKGVVDNGDGTVTVTYAGDYLASALIGMADSFASSGNYAGFYDGSSFLSDARLRFPSSTANENYTLTDILTLAAGTTVGVAIERDATSGTRRVAADSSFKLLAIQDHTPLALFGAQTSAIIDSTLKALLMLAKTETLSLDGSFSTGSAIITKIGPLVVLSMQNKPTHSSGTSASTTSGWIPAEYRPNFRIDDSYFANAGIECMALVETTGQLTTLYTSGGSGSPRSDTLVGFSLVWTV